MNALERWTLIIAAMGPFVGLLSVVINLLNKSKLQDIHVSLDGRLDELIRSSVAEGNAVGRKEQTVERAAAASKLLDQAKERANDD